MLNKYVMNTENRKSRQYFKGIECQKENNISTPSYWEARVISVLDISVRKTLLLNGKGKWITIITGVMCGRYIRWKIKMWVKRHLMTTYTRIKTYSQICMISWKLVEVHCVRWKGQKTSLQYRSVLHKQTNRQTNLFLWIWP